MDEWREGLTHKDWMLDGHTVTGWRLELFNDLDWSKAWVDAGPSPAGNLGPYWHAPRKDGETIHRLYPKVLAGKWGALIHQAVVEHTRITLSRAAALPSPPKEDTDPE